MRKIKFKFKTTKGGFKIYICRICNKNDYKKSLERQEGMCMECYEKEDVYQIFNNGKYKKLKIDNLWNSVMHDSSKKLYGLFLCIYKHHKGITLTRFDGGTDDNPEFIETDLFPRHIKTIMKILK